jgi:hypothetical protein
MLTVLHPLSASRNVVARDGGKAFVIRRITFGGSKAEHHTSTAGSKEYGGCYPWAAQAAFFADCTKTLLQSEVRHLRPAASNSYQRPSSGHHSLAFTKDQLS